MKIVRAMLLVLVAALSMAAVADSVSNEWGTVDYGWLDATTFSIHIYNIPDFPLSADPTMPSLFCIVNCRDDPSLWGTAVWGTAVDESFFMFFLSVDDHTLGDVGITINSFVPYHTLSLNIPSQWNVHTLIAEGDPIWIYLAWINFNDPLFSFLVPGFVPPSPPPHEPPPPPQPRLIVACAKNDDGSVTLTVMNVGDGPAAGPLGVKAGLSYTAAGSFKWVPESVTQFYKDTLGAVALEPGKALVVTVALPEVPQWAIDAFKDMITRWWTGYKDPEPETDYIGIGIGIGDETAWCFISVPAFFPPPR